MYFGAADKLERERRERGCWARLLSEKRNRAAQADISQPRQRLPKVKKVRWRKGATAIWRRWSAGLLRQNNSQSAPGCAPFQKKRRAAALHGCCEAGCGSTAARQDRRAGAGRQARA